jgi:tRNA-dihydrouridine synthase
MVAEGGMTRSITVKVRTSRKGTEALRLEIQRLAERLGLPAAAVRVRRVDGRPRSPKA